MQLICKCWIAIITIFNNPFQSFFQTTIIYINNLHSYIVSSTNTPGQNGLESNGNERVFYTLQVSRTRVSPPEAVYPT